MPPQIYQIHVVPPRDHPFKTLDRNRTPTWPLIKAPKTGTSTSTSPYTTTRKPKEGPNTRGARGVLRIPLLDHLLGGMPRQIYKIHVVPPRDHPFTTLDRNRTPTWPLMEAPKAGTNTSTRHRIQQTEKPKEGPNNRRLRVIAIDFFGTLYTENHTAVFEIKYLLISTYKSLQIRKEETQQETKTNATAAAAAVKRGLVLTPGTSYQGWCYFLICWVYFFLYFRLFIDSHTYYNDSHLSLSFSMAVTLHDHHLACCIWQYASPYN